MAPRVGDLCNGRENNFNLIRMVAATAVLVSHAYPVALGKGSAEPLTAWIGQSLGTVAVLVFFGISGFLIARSLDRAQRLSDWTAARVMRLFPGLFVVVVLTALVYGPLVTERPLDAYFGDSGVFTYVLRNLTLVRLQYDLPGVFQAKPYPGAINGPLWTLLHEVLCYAGVLGAGLLGLLRRPVWMAGALIAYGVFYVVGLLPAVEPFVSVRVAAFHDLSLPFVIGTAFYVWRDRIALGAIGCALLALPATALLGTVLFAPAFALWLTYTVFVLAYLPSGAVRRYNLLGDYSYGVYIYAFPMQQLAMHLAGGQMSPAQNIAIAAPATLALAILSWHLVEKPALDRRGLLAERLSLARRATPA